MIVRLTYQDGTVEDHELKNGVHFADYIRRVDVPGSEFAFALGDQQIRYLSVSPKREDAIKTIDLVKGDDNSAPIVMAVTIERLDTQPEPADSEDAADTAFKVILDPTRDGSIALDPPLPPDGTYKAGTSVTVRATPAPGFAIDSIYYSVPGRWGAMYHESLTDTFEIKVDQEMNLGASFIADQEVSHLDVRHNIVYARPGKKTLKYDVYSPKGAANLPIVVIIHGGGWATNDEDIMRGLARELTKGGQFVVCSVDYRWIGTLDGDESPNSMANLIEDVFGAVAHIMEHAKEYGGDAKRIGVTGDSAGGHLSASVSTMIERLGSGGFGENDGVYQFRPTYLPEGKTPEQLRGELAVALKAAAPSYGVFSVESLVRFQQGMTNSAAEATSPLSNVPPADSRTVPHYLARGTKDFLIPDEAVSAFATELTKKGHPAVYDQVDEAGHAFFDWKPNDSVKETFKKYGVPYAEKMKAFFAEHL